MLIALIKDITDEAYNKDLKAKGLGAYYNGKPNAKKAKGKGLKDKVSLGRKT